MDELTLLQEMGFTKTESLVYITLLETGSTKAGILVKKTGLHKATLYLTLQRLIEKGLVHFIIHEKKRYFEATEPQQILTFLKQKEILFQNMLPALIKKKNENMEQQEVTVYSGQKGIKTVLDAILNDLKGGGEYLDFGVSGLFREKIGSYWDYWQKQKKKQRIYSKCIFDASLKKTTPSLLKEYYGNARFHNAVFRSLTDTMIYHNTVVLFLWTAKPLLAIVIKNKENAESYRNQFMFMWKNAKK